MRYLDINLALTAIQIHYTPVNMLPPAGPDHLAETRYQKILLEQQSFVWRRFADNQELLVYVFRPENQNTPGSSSATAPAVLFFHGGMWVTQNPCDFVPWALHLSQQGICCILPIFRTRDRYDVTGIDILTEAREAWLWTYENAAILGIDPARITVAGSDAGGLMALHVALPDKPAHRSWFARFRKSPPPPPGPAAIALFRGVTDLTDPAVTKLTESLPQQMLTELNPIKRVQKKLPPLFICHGARDKLLASAKSERLAKLWRKKKNPVCLELVDAADHTFYHFNVNAMWFEQLLNTWSAFMVTHDIWSTQSEWILDS